MPTALLRCGSMRPRPPHAACIKPPGGSLRLRLRRACALRSRHMFAWPVNYASMQPGGSVMAVVGDDPDTLLLDDASGGVVATLRGHLVRPARTLTVVASLLGASPPPMTRPARQARRTSALRWRGTPRGPCWPPATRRAPRPG